MKVLCFGSLNIDMTFSVPHFVQAGETLASFSLTRNAGGKGANQAAALAKAGCETYMAGKVGKDGMFLVETLEDFSVDCSNVVITDNPSGQAIIQLAQDKQNAIILFAGENRNITEEEVDSVLSGFNEGDWIVLQNEINLLDRIIMKAHSKGLKICFNPAPFDDGIKRLPLNLVNMLVVNEIEGAALAGISTDFESVIKELSKMYPSKEILVFPSSPPFVVTKTTPLAARAPYIEAEPASLSTSILAISLGFMWSILSTIKPSTT